MKSSANELPEVQAMVRGEVSADAVAYARTKVADLATRVREPVLFARVKLTQGNDPAVVHPAVAQANLDVDGKLVRANADAKTMREAVDLLVDRLKERLVRLNEHWEARRGRQQAAEAHARRHENESAQRHLRPVGEREVIRHQSYAVPSETPDEAAFEMESMDYDFHLFTDLDSGLDSVIYRDEPSGYRLAHVGTRSTPLGPLAVPLTLSEVPAPSMSLTEAEQHLDATGLPFVFFADEGTGRGCVLYHRYDGHYGLITPNE